MLRCLSARLYQGGSTFMKYHPEPEPPQALPRPAAAPANPRAA
jgi:hypothetical protein